MAKSKDATSLWNELWTLGLYKKNQGRLTRQVTGAALGLLVTLGAYTLFQTFAADQASWIRVGIPTAITVIGIWVTYRLVNYPRFADFLISVEAEMDKVTWSTRQELYRAAAVVIVTMFLFGFVLFFFDMFWQWFFRLVGFLRL